MATQVSRYVWTMGKPEREAVKRLWEKHRIDLPSLSYRRLRKRFRYSTLMGCWIGDLYGMTVGIEADGHTHS